MTSTPRIDTDVIRLGHSPDPDDAFMFYALARDLIDAEGLKFEHILRDIETLNVWAEEGRLEVTAVSLNAYTGLTDKYLVLNTGASMGRAYGPMVVAREPYDATWLAGKTIVVPGVKTTAFLTLKMCIGEFEYKVVPFDKIFDAVHDGQADAGLIIHEGQLTYEKEGFYKIIDLGEWWDRETGLPLPLGINLVRKDLGPELCRRIDRVLKRSVQYSLDHRAPAVEYALQFGRGLDNKMADQFVGMYVNDLTLDTGGIGRPAIEAYLDRARKQGLIPADMKAEFVA